MQIHPTIANICQIVNNFKDNFQFKNSLRLTRFKLNKIKINKVPLFPLYILFYVAKFTIHPWRIFCNSSLSALYDWLLLKEAVAQDFRQFSYSSKKPTLATDIVLYCKYLCEFTHVPKLFLSA